MRVVRLFLILLFFPLLCAARHIVGGELYYDNLGGNNYKITLKVYRDCGISNPPAFDSPARITIYDANGILVDTLNFTFTGSSTVPPTINNPCFTAPTGICVDFTIYTGTVNLPLKTGGYYLIYQRCCRNGSIFNITNPGSTGATYMEHIPGPELVAINNSPRFNTYPPIFICSGADINFNHSATDPDGDSLVYDFCDPYTGLDACCPLLIASASNPAGGGCINPPVSGICPTFASPPPYASVSYASPYSGSYPLSSNPAIQINHLTGHISGTPNITGQWVVGVCVKEYRHGVLIGTHLRDFQFNVTPCPNLIISAIQQQTQLCGGLTVNFNNISSGGTGYSWFFGDPANHADSSHLTNPSYTYPDTGTYIVTLINHGPFPSCNDTSKQTFHVLPLLNPALVTPAGQCIQGNSFNFTAGGQFAPYSTFNWNFTAAGTPSSSTQQNPNGITFSQTGQIIIALTVHEKSCDKTVNDTITIYPLTTAKFRIDSAKGCAPLKVTFKDSSQFGGGQSFLWSFGDGTTSTLENPTHIYQDTGKFTVSLVVTTTLGCIGSSTFSANNMVTVFPGPKAGFEVNPTHTTIYYNFIHFIDTSKNANVQTVNMGDGSVFTNFPVEYGYQGSGTFTVTQIAISSNGCSDTARRVILIDPDWTFYIPNTFTPNGDNLNDVFKCEGVGFTDFNMIIYDRWGNKIMETSDINKGWDGTLHGKPCEEDVYVYKVEFTNIVDYYPRTLRGHIKLIR